MKIELRHSEWDLGPELGNGSFGKVFQAIGSHGSTAAVKLIPKTPGAKRELLFEERLSGARNVVPILDSGEDEDHWIIAMPRAEQSLREEIIQGPMNLTAARKVLEDVTDALADLQTNGIVHRDLKPENILKLNGTWCIADFGISRYAEAATAASTHKYAWTPAYAAPEQWRLEHATSATDMYALGVMAFELVSGARPFNGTQEELREAHLHADVPPSNAPKKLAWLIEECLAKAPEYRPSASEFRKRLDLSMKEQTSAGLLALQDANQAQAKLLTDLARKRSEAKTENERRAALAKSGRYDFARISAEILEQLTDNAPGANVTKAGDGSWALKLNMAGLQLSAPTEPIVSWGSSAPAFEVLLMSSLSLTCQHPVRGYNGRAHSLWFGDVEAERDYAWYETAFIKSVWLRESQTATRPYSLPPSQDAAEALVGAGRVQHAWPFMRVDAYDLSEFVDRWSQWFAAASQGQLQPPNPIPERSPGNSWRK